MTADQHPLVTANLKLAYWCAKPFHNPQFDADQMETLNSVALAALCKAAQKYDPSFRLKATGQPVKFTTYATISIKNALYQFVARENRRLRPCSLSNVEDDINSALLMHEDDPIEYKASDRVALIIEKTGLNERHKTLIQYRYVEGLSKTKTAKLMGVSTERVRQMEAGILERMRRACQRHGITL